MNKYEGPSKEYPVSEVKFKSGRKEKFISYMETEFKSCVDERAPEEAKWKNYALQANSRRKRKDAKGRDSQLDMTLTRERMGQNKARIMNPIFQHDRQFVGKPRTPAAAEAASRYEKILDFIMDRIDARSLVSDWIEQGQIFPVGVLKTPWVHEKKKIRKWEQADFDEVTERIMAGEELKTWQYNDAVYVEVEDNVDYRRGAFPEVIPVEDFYFPMGSKCVDSAPWVCHRLWMNKSDINCEIKNGRFPSKIDGDSIFEVIGKSSREPEHLLKHDPEDQHGSMESKPRLYEVLEIYAAYDVDGDGEDEEIIAWFDRESWTLLRCVHNFYQSYSRPFVTWCHKSVLGSIYGIPLTYILEPLHAAYTASFNQRLDAASRANEVLLLAPPGSGILEMFDQNRLHGGVYELNIDPSEIKEFKVSQPFTQLPELEDRLEIRADRVSGLSDYSFGQEQISRPTATGQVQIIEESKQPLYMMLEGFRKKYAEVAKHMLARYRQFSPAGLEIYFQSDPESGEFFTDFITWPDESFEEDVLIETSASSANMSQQLRKQEIIAMVDKYQMLIRPQMDLVMAASDVMNPAAPAANALLGGFHFVLGKFFQEFEMPQQELVNPDLVKAVNYGQMVQQRFQQMQMQMQQMQQQNQQMQMQLGALQGGMPNGPPGPGPGMGGPPGPPQGVPQPGPMGPQPAPNGGGPPAQI